MSRESFDELLGLVDPIIKTQSWSRDVIPTGLMLALTIRYLATGDSMASMSYAERIGRSTVSGIIRKTCDALWTTLHDRVMPEPTEDSLKNIAKDFNNTCNFLNCVGSIDGKHVVVQAPNNSGSMFYNYKGAHSLVLMAACDANYLFTYVDIGAPGRLSDGGIFKNSIFGKAIINNSLPLPPPVKIVTTNTLLPSVFVADAAFPLRPNLMRPYPGARLSNEQIIFNYRLSRARRTIENVFGNVPSRWRIFRKAIIASEPTVNSIIKAVTCLHNFLQIESNRKRGPPSRRYCPPGLVDYEDQTVELHLGRWRGDQCDGLRPLTRTGSNMYTLESKAIRQTFARYFMEEGSVPWQADKLPNV